MVRGATNKPIRDFPEEVAAAVQKRARAIRYRGAKVELARVKEVLAGTAEEQRRLDIDISYRVASLMVLCRLIVWNDRWVWVDVRRRSKQGWLWAATVEGRFIAAEGAREIVQNIERTIDVASSAPETVVHEVERIWKPCLAQGPKLIR